MIQEQDRSHHPRLGSPATAKPFVRALALHAFQIADGFPNTQDGLLPMLVREAGFQSVAETYRRRTALGSLGFFEATR